MNPHLDGRKIRLLIQHGIDTILLACCPKDKDAALCELPVFNAIPEQPENSQVAPDVRQPIDVGAGDVRRVKPIIFFDHLVEIGQRYSHADDRMIRFRHIFDHKDQVLDGNHFQSAREIVELLFGEKFKLWVDAGVPRDVIDGLHSSDLICPIADLDGSDSNPLACQPLLKVLPAASHVTQALHVQRSTLMRHPKSIPVVFLDSPLFQKVRVVWRLIGLHDHGVFVKSINKKTSLTVGVEPCRADDLNGAGLLQILSGCVKQCSGDLVIVE